MKRIVIYTSDIRILTDKSESYARKEIQNLRKVLNKEKHQKITIRANLSLNQQIQNSNRKHGLIKGKRKEIIKRKLQK